MNKIWFKISGEKVFEAVGLGSVCWGMYYSKQVADGQTLRNLRLIYLGRGFYIHVPLKWYKKFTKPKEVIEKKPAKVYRYDLKLYEERVWFIWKYSIFGKPNQYSLFRK